MKPDQPPVAHPPETLEGWYALHQIYSVQRDVSPGVTRERVDSTQSTAAKALATSTGWTAAAKLIGSSSDLLVVHFRETLDDIGKVQDAFKALPLANGLRLDYSFLSVTEAGLYHLTAQLAKQAAERGGTVGDAEYTAELTKRSAAERDSAHVQRRLYPPLPGDMPYVCFYPMSKRRQTGQNWYSLTLDERSQLMYTHGLTGRRYAGRILQIISGAIGFDAWEWGVTLFGKDPLDFKKIVTDMRFDEVSAKYAEFGDFYVGKLLPVDQLETFVETSRA
ncbi:MAG TPA: hydrogen peroxide-dependent heme synthase [Gemmatimonadaceae bacterium]|jgi:chlorite dismutase